jgi:outer membrane protein OmpA-like peptidoglycan-associated protein
MAAQEQPTEQQILDALKTHGPSRRAHDFAADERAAQERRLIQALIKKTPRSVTIDERRMVAEIASRKPSIDLDIPFDFNSAVISPQAVPVLVTLGRALSDAELVGATFLVAGHTDAKGGDAYNQDLSERRADSVRRYLAERFKLSPDQLLAIGFGKTQLKNAADPTAAENRRVQVVNMEVK